MISRRNTLGAAAAAALAACSSTPLLESDAKAPVPPPAGTPPLPAPPAPPVATAPADPATLAPAVPREFRAAWVATVANIDWPSKPGLSAEQQIAEMRSLLDRAEALKLNAIILQVRTCADALYESALEPWSEYLSGQQGRSPGYDPLARWVAEAHARGMELHAWLNPFRARPSAARSAAAANHLSRSRPQWVRKYGDQLWIDPGESEAAEHTLAVFKDVLQRYDIDGIHIDDYFYPYPIPRPGSEPGSREELDFPDGPAWQRYLSGGGTLGRADWRRGNVDALIYRLYRMVRETKPGVRIGISPFGLGKPALRPEGIVGFSQYDSLYADVEHWLEQGWLDYLVPQLYWPREPRAQAFAPLLDYWHGRNPQRRHVWPGLFTSRIQREGVDKPESWPVAEIVGQIELVRASYPGTGHAHFSMVALAQNRRGLADALRAGPYAQPALVPATPWLGQPACAAVQAGPLRAGGPLRLAAPGGAAPTRYALWWREAGAWRLQLALPGAALVWPATAQSLVVSAFNASGEEGPRKAYAPA